MTTRTKSQNTKLYGLLMRTELWKQKSNLVLSFTKGRTEHSSEMTEGEAGELIKYLQGIERQAKASHAQRADDMRKKIISMAHEIGWEIPGTNKIDIQRIDRWAQKYGYLHKSFNSYTYQELPKLVSQFEQLYYSNLKTIKRNGTR